jgi:GntR family transcriptional regulator, arabinose operon transcriptional repressor
MKKQRRLVGEYGPKYQQIMDVLSRDILGGKYKSGQKFPSESVLVRQFGTSRITVGRAVRELKERGLVQRIAGSGTYVRARVAAKSAQLFGLLIPDLGETEIFEPICNGMAGAPRAGSHALLWGSTEPTQGTKEAQALKLCHQFIARKVSGVFFAPLELTPRKDETNRAIAQALATARIPIVLLDRCFMPFPQRSKHDLVAIDHRRAGYLITEHLLKLGCRRIVFVGYSNSAPSVEARIAGFREALFSYGVPLESDSVQRLASTDPDKLKELLKSVRPEAFVCVNDQTAGRLMTAALDLGYQIPGDVRIVGIDDLEYAKLLPVPLTTIHQPCREIGQAAMAVMLERIEQPGMTTRDVLLDCELVVRRSCGGSLL